MTSEYFNLLQKCKSTLRKGRIQQLNNNEYEKSLLEGIDEEYRYRILCCESECKGTVDSLHQNM